MKKKMIMKKMEEKKKEKQVVDFQPRLVTTLGCMQTVEENPHTSRKYVVILS